MGVRAGMVYLVAVVGSGAGWWCGNDEVGSERMGGGKGQRGIRGYRNAFRCYIYLCGRTYRPSQPGDAMSYPISQP